MASAHRRFVSWITLAACALTVACSRRPEPFRVEDRSPRSDREARFDPPNSYPEWAYDAPKYARPAAELPPEPRVRKKDPLHYFTNKKTIMIRRPTGYTPDEIPRVALWWTDDNGFHWDKAGYFGRNQDYFPFTVEEDGDYGIRFVGPGQTAALHALPMPTRVYHLDTVPPEIELTIEPEQTWYYPGQAVAVSWRTEDYHLVAQPVRVGVLTDYAAADGVSIELQHDLADAGAIAYTIPQEMLGYAIRFRADALDRAGNLGFAYSHALQIVEKATVEDVTVNTSVETDTGSTGTEADESAQPAVLQNLADAQTGADDPNCGSAADEDVVTVASQDLHEPRAAEVETPVALSQEHSAVGSLFKMFGDEAAEAIVSLSDRWNTADDVAVPTASRSPADAARTSGTGDSPEDAQSVGPPDTAVVARSNDMGVDEWGDVDPGDCPPEEIGTQADLPLTPPPTALAAGFDPTRGNGLWVPLPATVAPEDVVVPVALGRPWRLLLDSRVPLGPDVWRLPQPQFGDALYRTFEGQFLVQHRSIEPLGEPGQTDHTLAGSPETAENPLPEIHETP
ncbi:MAG: hypothetical protein ACE5F9_11630 [Phycisphaerae bacterium]